jgi:WS/DGAT/MGAT family acyltransferase
MWLIDGLSGGRFAMIIKNHHAMIDGIAGVDITTVILDIDRNEKIAEPKPWNPRPLPTQGELLELAGREAVRTPFRLMQRAVDAVRDQERTKEEVGEFVHGMSKAFTETMDAAPRTPLNTEITGHRRFKLVRNSLEDFKEIKTLLDTTVNDVVLTVVSDALGRWLRTRYYPTDGLKLRALVPVSTRPRRRRGEGAHEGNELLAMRGSLPVEEMDVLKRLNYIKDSMDHLKHTNNAVAADALTAVQSFAPPTILAQASRINFSTRLFNLLVTNVPGPQVPLYLLGRQMLDAFPLPFLARGHALAVAAMSYNGNINFGLLGDYDAMSDIQVIADGLSDSRDDLLGAAAEVKNKARQIMRTGPDVGAIAATAEGAAATAAKARSKRTTKPAAAARVASPKPRTAKNAKRAKPAAKPRVKAERNGSDQANAPAEVSAALKVVPPNGSAPD